MGLFDKKFCDVCGGKIGLLGNRKLEDGNLCKDCAKKLSPWFSERRHSTLQEIKDQLAYREENRAAVAAFHITRTLGADSQVLLDEDAGKFMVATTGNLETENPDVLDFSQVTGCSTNVQENRTEIRRQGPDGKEVSYNPPRYRYDYDFYVTINVNGPYFDEIRFRLNPSSVEVFSEAHGIFTQGSGEGRSNPEYQQYERMGNEIKQALTQVRTQVRQNIAAAKAPKTAVTCPHCGATTTPDANGRCEFCGGSIS